MKSGNVDTHTYMMDAYGVNIDRTNKRFKKTDNINVWHEVFSSNDGVCVYV